MRSVYLVPGLVLNLLGATFALRRAGVVALASAFVSSVMKGRALQECLCSDVVAGSLVTTTRGDYSSGIYQALAYS